jgi:hypothetical protein
VGDAVLDGVTTERVAGPGWEQWCAGFTCAFDKPAPKDSNGRRHPGDAGGVFGVLERCEPE